MPAVSEGSVLATSLMRQKLQKAQQVAQGAEACAPRTQEFTDQTTELLKLTQHTPMYLGGMAAVQRQSNNNSAAAEQLSTEYSKAVKTV